MNNKNSLLNNYIIGYAVEIRNKKGSIVYEWRKWTVSKTMFEKIGYANSLAAVTRRIFNKDIEGNDIDLMKVQKAELLALIEDAEYLEVLHDPNVCAAKLKKEEGKTTKVVAETSNDTKN
jgi:hypothetical protein